jgi:hypothetical protein
LKWTKPGENTRLAMLVRGGKFGVMERPNASNAPTSTFHAFTRQWFAVGLEKEQHHEEA